MIVGLCLLALAIPAPSGNSSTLCAPGPEVSSPIEITPLDLSNNDRKRNSLLQSSIKPGFGPSTAKKPNIEPESAPFRNIGLSTSQRVDDLLARLKPEDKVQFLSIHQGAIDHLGIPTFDWLDTRRSTLYPHPIGIASSFDLDLATRMATEETRLPHAANNAWFVPIEVAVEPRWGLVTNTFGEDPLLVGRMASTTVDAVKANHGIAVLGQFGRFGRIADRSETIAPSLPDRDLALTHIPPVWDAIVSQPSGALWLNPNAQFGNGTLLQNQFIDATVRRNWGLKGPLIDSDIGLSGSQTSKDLKGTPAAALLAGCTLFPEDAAKALTEAAKTDEKISNAIDQAVRIVLTSEMVAGRFDPITEKNGVYRPSDELSQLRLRAAHESLVLLKNDHELLPLKPEFKTVAVIGPDATSVSSLLGSEQTPMSDVVTPLEAIKKALGANTKVTYERGTGFIGRDDLQTVPSSAFSDGVTAEYFEKSNLIGTPVTRNEPQIDAQWKAGPVDGITTNGFSASWTGAIAASVTGQYGIGFTVEGGARLYIDDQLVIDDWKDGPIRTKTIPVSLEADQFYVIRVEYQNGKAGGALKLVWSTPQKEPYRAAIEAAIKADAVIMVLGLGPSLENDHKDRIDLNLPDSQQGLLDQILDLHRPTIVVLLNGGPLSVVRAKKDAGAILEAWYPGEAGGQAIADVLTGSFNPCGKLPITFYQSVEQLPDPLNTTAPRGYRFSLYRPLFPFGSGLSYTRFSYSDLIVPTTFEPGKPVRVSVTVKNSGKRDGDEIVQLYLSHGAASTGMPRVALKDFRRVHLATGESRRVSFVLQPKDLAALRDDGSWWIEPELLRVCVGGNQPMEDQPAVQSAHTRPRTLKAFKI